jgi:hypothetical protein
MAGSMTRYDGSGFSTTVGFVWSTDETDYCTGNAPTWSSSSSSVTPKSNIYFTTDVTLNDYTHAYGGLSTAITFT